MQCGKSSVTLYRIVPLLHNWTSGCASRFPSVSHKFCHEPNFPGMHSFDKGISFVVVVIIIIIIIIII